MMNLSGIYIQFTTSLFSQFLNSYPKINKIQNPNRFDFEKKKFCLIETVFTFLKLADKSKHVLFHVIFTSDLPFWRRRDRKGDSSEKICRPDRFWPAVQPVYVRS
jgi:hypothetical protein